jgi:hypothetical protein
MALHLRVVEDPVDKEQAAVEWLHQAKDSVLACRGQGHHWPKLKPNRGRPIRGLKHYVRDGQVEITMTCLDGCGKERQVITPPSGMIDMPARYRYNKPEGYSPPKGVQVTGRMAFQESNRRWIEDLQGMREGAS